MSHLPVIDSFGRIHSSLRIGVTDRCNIRCTYCMPESVQFLSRPQLLTFEEIGRIAKIVAGMGVHKIRLTGGEPLVRAELWRLIEILNSVGGIDEIALTTNGILLAQQAQSLKNAGLQRLNISLDTVRENVFRELTRRDGLENVFAGIDQAQQAGFEKIRLNAVSIRHLTEPEIVPLAQFALERNLHLRFIEFMPFDGSGTWKTGDVLSGLKVKSILESHFGGLEPVARVDSSQPAMDYRYLGQSGLVGFINSVTQPFCSNCNRMRLTAEGKFRNCLFSDDEWDVRSLLRGNSDDCEIADTIRECIANKKAGHGMDSEVFQRSNKAMYEIGG